MKMTDKLEKISRSGPWQRVALSKSLSKRVKMDGVCNTAKMKKFVVEMSQMKFIFTKVQVYKMVIPPQEVD